MTQEEAEDITLYHCSACEPAHGPTVVANRRKSLRETKKLNYTNEAAVHEYYWTKILQGKTFGKDDFERLHGDQINLDWARKTGLHRPVVVPSPDGLDMKMPDSRISVSEIADLVGRNTLVECLQVATQSSEVMSLGDWANYFSLKPEKRNRLLNVITLEIGSSRLAERIQRPALVRQLDWVNLTWPKHLVESRESPQVQLYCLMGVANSYTDFHIDFGGSSVFYHILSGEKIFYFVEPTRNNLKSYEHWGSSALQSSTFFPDTLEPGTCKKVKLVAGNTMIIPTGWIHAVFTPVDTIVIGGNFIHGLNISRQLDCVTLENRTDVPLKFR